MRTRVSTTSLSVDIIRVTLFILTSLATSTHLEFSISNTVLLYSEIKNPLLVAYHHEPITMRLILKPIYMSLISKEFLT